MNRYFKSEAFNSLFFIGIFYLLAHGGILFIPNALYWDDWVWYDNSPDALMKATLEMGRVFYWLTYLHVFILSIGLWLYKVLTFVLMFLSGIFLWFILKSNIWISKELRFLVVLLFLILPFNHARVVLSTFQYTFSYFLFFLGWFFLGKSRLLSLFLFLLSFRTNSMLVFYTLPIVEWYFRDSDMLKPKKLWQWGIRRLDFLLLPFVFFVVKIIFFKPNGLYHGYNTQFSLKSLFISPVYMAFDFTRLHVNVFLFIACTIACFFIIHKRMLEPGKSDVRMLYAGLLAFICAVFPYWILGHTPTFHEWTSRHQLLLPLGISLILIWFIFKYPPTTRVTLLSIAIGLFISMNIQAYSGFFLDWDKQKSLISLMSVNDEIRDGRLIVFIDESENALERTYRFYEWNSLMKMAFGDEKRFGINRVEYESYKTGLFDSQYSEDNNASQHTRSTKGDHVVVRIDSQSKSYLARIKRLLTGEPGYSIDIVCSGTCQ
jgi:hypothetical protein